MKHAILRSTLLALAAVALCAPMTLQAQTATPAATPAAKEKGKAASASPKIQYMGNLTALDAAANTITVENKGASMNFTVDAATKILVDKKPAKLADFAVGDKVTGSYMKADDGKMTAASLHKKTEAAAAKPGATPAAK